MDDDYHLDETEDAQSVESSLLARLVAECLDRVAERGPGAVTEFCAEHAEHAEAIQRRIESLQKMGLLDVEPSAAADFPEELGPFHLIRRLGSGGMGVVYLAEQRPLGRTVALKLMRPDQVFFSASRQRFEREILAVARLHHPGIVAVYTAGEEGGIPFFAMEFVRGCSLGDALSALRRSDPAALSAQALLRAVADDSPAGDGEEPDSIELTDASWTDVCLRLTLQVAEALAHAHGKGIHHRDIKPSNIMVTRAGRAMLLDFGLASASGTSRLTQSGSQLGSLPYMAPESLEGGHAADGSVADVYSLGVTLYELLTLHSPFLDKNPSVTIRKVLQGEPDPIRMRHPAVSWAAETVCRKAMDRDPARRYASAEEFGQDLRNALENRPILARRPGALLRVRRWSRRHPARAVAVVAGVLLLSSSVTYGALQQATNRALKKAGEEKDQALSDLETRNDELDAALAEVDENFGRVVSAGIRMLSRVGFDVLQNVPLSDGVRRQLLDEAERLALELQRDEPDDPRLRFEMARTVRLLGAFHGDMGDYEKEDVQLRQATAILERLLAEQPDHEDALEQLVRTYHGLGASLVFRRKHDLAAEAYQSGAAAGVAGLGRLEASGAPNLTLDKFRMVTAMNMQGAGMSLHFLERLEEADQAFHDARFQLSRFTEIVHAQQQEIYAVCCVNHGSLLLTLGRIEDACAAMRVGIEQLRAVLAREPGNAGNRINLGRAMGFLAGILPKGDPESVPLARDAVAELRRARRDFPGSIEAVESLAGALGRLGTELKEREQYASAQACFEEQIALLRPLLRSQIGAIPEALVGAKVALAECLVAVEDYFPAEELFNEALATSSPWIDDPSAQRSRRSHTVVALEGIARFLAKVGMPEEAAPHVQRALDEAWRELRESPNDPRQVEAVSTTALLSTEIDLQLHDHRAALVVLESLGDVPPTDEDLLHAARLASCCIRAATEDSNLEDGEREALVGRGAAVALAFLERLQDKSLFAAQLGGGEYDSLVDQPGFGEWWSQQ